MWLERQVGATIDWRPFDLHPEYPGTGIPRADLHAKYGEQAMRRTRGMIEESGFRYDPPPEVVPNSLKALQVTEFARQEGLHAPVHTRLMEAYWSEAADIGDEDTLLALVEEVGLDRAAAAESLATGAFRAAVSESTAQAHRLGINAIPAFVLDERMLVLGAHPPETFERAFEQLAAMPDGD